MRKALVIGINDYPSTPLSGCVNDANSIANVIEVNGDGSPNFSVKLITSPPAIATRSSIRKNIEDLFSGNADVCLLYFSGHGFIKTTGGYLVTTDFNQYDEGISMDEVLNIANKSSIKDKIIILDCCHSGSFGTPTINSSNLAQLSEGLTVLTASRDKESALEINGKGLFTMLVVDALRGGGADLRGHISPGSIYAYVDQALGPWDQRPIFKTNVTRFTSLRNVQPPIPLEVLRNICIYFEKPEDEFKLNPSFEFTSSEASDSNVKIFKELQKFESVGLVVPNDEEHMYFAAINSKSCRLTALGFQYWRLVKEKKV